MSSTKNQVEEPLSANPACNSKERVSAPPCRVGVHSQDDARRQLAAQQEEFLQSLQNANPKMAGFEQHKLHAAAAALADKRRRAVARAWPSLAGALGERFAEKFDAFAQNRSLPRDGGPLADGRAFASFLETQNELPDDARQEMMAVDLRYVRSASGLSPRRGVGIKVTRLGKARRLVLAVRFPWAGEWWLRLPFT